MTLYNPHLLGRQDLIDTFVARQPLLEALLDDLRRGGGQHHLVIGSRGTGKTTLLLRLAAAIEDDDRLANRCIPLRFPEEQYNVTRLSDLWINAIDALIDAFERRGDAAAAKQLESTVSELEPLGEEQRGPRSLAVLEGCTRNTGRLIVLLVDNLDLVLDRLSDSLWALRETLSVDNGLVVVGASSKFIEQAIDYQSPFYDFFRVHELGPLSEDEARSVVLSLARRANTPMVAETLEKDPGRFKTLYVLTGGTPRTLALLHTVLALDGTSSVERDLEGLLDQLTPYYKSRFDDLPAQSQVIVDKVALHWHPITAAECQAATQLDINVVSAQLSRLAKSGVLSKVSLPEPSKLGFQLSERFFNIWYLMRASRRLRRRLSWFVEFLRIFYGEEELRRRAEELVNAQPADSIATPARFLAFASAVPDQALRRRLEFRAIGLLIGEGKAALRQVMDLEGEDLHLIPVIDRVHAIRDIRDQITSAKVDWSSGRKSISLADTLVRHPGLSLSSKRGFARWANQGKVTELETFLEAARDHAIDLGDRLLNAIACGEVPALPDVTTLDEVRQVLALGVSRRETIKQLINATEGFGRPLSDENVRYLLSLDPLAAEAVLVVAAALVGHVPWARLRHLALMAAPQSAKPLEFAPLFLLLKTCVSQALVPEAVELLAASGMAERWAPLHEALLAVDEGSPTRLHALAPEMRAVALDIYKELSSVSLSVVPSRASDVAPRDGRRSKTRAGKRRSGATKPGLRRPARGRPSR